MVYLIVTDKEQFADSLISKLRSGIQASHTESTGESKVSFRKLIARASGWSGLEIVHTVFVTCRFNTDVHLILDAEILGVGKPQRQDLQGLELTKIFKTALRVGFRGSVSLFGFTPHDYVKASPLGRLVEREFAVTYLRLPLTSTTITTLIERAIGDAEKETTSGSFSKIMSEFGQTFLLGLVDDEAHTTLSDLEPCLSKELRKRYRISSAKVFAFPFSPESSFSENVQRLRKWIDYTEVFDLLLVDIQFQCVDVIEKEGGVEILKILSAIGYPIPVAMLSATSQRESIVASTTEYKHIVKSFLLIETATGGHGRKGVKNYPSIAAEICTALMRNGSVRNHVGVLITHGTDTMAWTHSLLCYAVKGQKCNIALTGSQIPLRSEFSPSDAPSNIQSSLYFLNQLVPPKIGVVFDYGKKFYESNLRKVRIWDSDAYEGDVHATFDWEEIASKGQTLRFDNTLDELCLFTTGGTIAMRDSEAGKSQATLSAMTRFFDSPSAKYRDPEGKRGGLFVTANPIEVCSIDSSEMNPKIYASLLDKLCNMNTSLQKRFGEGLADLIDMQWRWDVYPVMCSPLLKSSDYEGFLRYSEREPDRPVIFILLGYGAGNAPPQKEDGYSPIGFVEAATKKDIVVLSTQVPIETPDIDYEVATRFIEAGAIPCGDMSLAELSIKGSYLLGHHNSSDGLDFLKSALLAGVHFRSEHSRRRYLQKLRELKEQGRQGHTVPPVNYFKMKHYGEAREEALRFMGRFDN